MTQISLDLGLPPVEPPLPTRDEGLARLDRFLPRAGRAYAARRNYVLPGHKGVSGLSPWLRHRLVTESEVLEHVDAAHGQAAEKFVSEVLWRTYWKGWLERRPGVWAAYRSGLQAALNRVQTESGLRSAWAAACRGETGIDGFDAWAQELAATGYMHNHARMWFASIWIFTLRLPWELGADFFMRHLLDGDPASNTLSWRWVAGLHTQGKTYLARASNIAEYTDGKFRPGGLAREAPPLPFDGHPAIGAVPEGGHPRPGARSLLLVTEEDCGPEFLLKAGLRPGGVAALTAVAGRSPLMVASSVGAFAKGAVADALLRIGAPDAPVFDDATALADHATALNVDEVVTPYAPVGPVAAILRDLDRALRSRGIALVQVLRDHDRRCWPHATHGFFRFREGAR